VRVTVASRKLQV